MNNFTERARHSKTSERKSEDETDIIYTKEKRIRLSSHSNSYNNSNMLRHTSHITSRYNTERKIYKDQFPTTTIIIKGLVHNITENDIWKETAYRNAIPTDIRLIRNKETGELRGFAFLVFQTVQESSYFMEMNDGELILQNKCKASMEYSIPREYPNFVRNILQPSHGWCCIQCGFNNYTCRDTCYKCKGSRKRSCRLESERDEVCPYPTSTVLLRCLDVLSTEDSVLCSLKGLTSLPIRKIQIGQDALTKISRGVCYIEMNSIADSVKLRSILTSEPFFVDNKRVMVSYCKFVPISASPSMAAGPTKSNFHKNSVDLENYKLEDIPSLAEYGASLYAKTFQEHATYFKYYKQYYEMQLKQKDIATSNSLKAPNSIEIIGQPSVQQAQSKKESKLTLNHESEKNQETTVSPTTNNLSPAKDLQDSKPSKYSIPDVSKYIYDESSGYYYDNQTGFHYDATSQYYYNAKKQQFLYWDLQKQTYLPVITYKSTNTNDTNVLKCNGKKEQEKNKEDKIKVAKKIVKEMERWAKILNEKRDIARQNIVFTSDNVTLNKPMGSADVGFSVLERKENTDDDQGHLSALSRIITYDSGNESDDMKEEIEQHINWEKLACLLCKRQFQTKESLAKHQQLSELHQQNLEKWHHNQSNAYKTNIINTNSGKTALPSTSNSKNY